MNEPMDLDKLATESKVVAAGRPAKQPDGALNPPIALNSTFMKVGLLAMADMAMKPGVP